MGFLTTVWNTFLVVTSAVLLAYWFRFACLLILKTSPARAHAAKFAAANQLNFPVIYAQLSCQGAVREPDRIRELIDRDYRLLCYLLDHGTRFRSGGRRIERFILHLDFKIMRVYYNLSRRMAASQAHRALQEMADIVGHLANTMGEDAALVVTR